MKLKTLATMIAYRQVPKSCPEGISPARWLGMIRCAANYLHYIRSNPRD